VPGQDLGRPDQRLRMASKAVRAPALSGTSAGVRGTIGGRPSASTATCRLGAREGAGLRDVIGRFEEIRGLWREVAALGARRAASARSRR